MDIQVKEFIENATCFGPESTTLNEAVHCMHECSLNVYTVLDEEKKVIGIVTMYDILGAIIPDYLKGNVPLAEYATDKLMNKAELRKALDLTVGDVMTEDPITVDPEDYFMEVAAKMYDGDHDYVPVVKPDNTYVGVVARSKMDDEIVELLKREKSSK